MSGYMGVKPAYGRDYKSQKEVKADWDANKDFIITDFGPNNGRYVNKEQVAGRHIIVRYAKLTKQMQVQ